RLALADGFRVPLPPDTVELRAELPAVGDRARGVPLERPRRQLRRAEREQHLAGRGRVADARAAELRDALHRRARLREVDGDRVSLAGRGERRRLAGLGRELADVRARDLAEVQAAEDGVP